MPLKPVPQPKSKTDPNTPPAWFFKITLVIILSVYHMYLGVVRKKLINEPSKYTSKYFRYINEVPTILLMLSVILVVVKPF